jgi:exonuclease VII large subunit
MMDDATNMSTPVTRGELKAELEQFEIRLDQKLDQKLQKLEQKLDQKLGLWGGALRAQIEASEQRLLTELARHVRAIQEALSTQVSVIDEKYADLPARVKHLEATVFRPKRR